MTDIEIINKITRGDETAFKELVDTFQKKVLNTCYRFVQNVEDAEDITQEVFIEVFRSVSKFRGNSKLSTWIYRISVTKSLDYLRHNKRKKRSGIVKRLFGDDQLEEHIKAPAEQNPEEAAENEERIRVLTLALESLPDNQRTAFTLSKYDELSNPEIAEILETSISAVESLVHRAKKNLQKKLYTYYRKHL